MNPFLLFVFCIGLAGMFSCVSPVALEKTTEAPVVEKKDASVVEQNKEILLEKQKQSLYQECTTDMDCQSAKCREPLGLGVKICTLPCVDNEHCGKGSVCENHGATGFCVPSCQSSADCSSFTSMPYCNPEGHCWIRWNVLGMQCQEPQECLSSQCQEPDGLGFNLCSENCQKQEDCPSAFLCWVKQGKGQCIPACSKDEECKKYSSTPLCKNKQHCWKIE